MFRSCCQPVLTAILFVGLFAVVHAQSPPAHPHPKSDLLLGHSFTPSVMSSGPLPGGHSDSDLPGIGVTGGQDFLASLSEPDLDCVTPAETPQKKFPDIQIFGLLQADGIWFGQDRRSEAALGDISDVVDLRRTRIGAQGDVAENVGFFLLYDFSLGGRPTFIDLWGEVRDVGPVEALTIGRFRVPQGMDALTNIPVTVFMERSTPTALVPFRQTGLQGSGYLVNEDATYAGAVYKYPTDPFGGGYGDDGYGAAGRLTVVLFSDDDDDALVHGGLSLSYNQSDGSPYRYRTIPGVGATFGDFDDPVPVIPAFVDTGPITAHSSTIAGYEAAVLFGPVHVQSEAVIAHVDQVGGPALDFPGFTVQAAWVVTAEKRAYDRRYGVFAGVPVENNWGKGGCGAWEVAARWSLLDLTDANIRGGRLRNVTLGVNWYLNTHTRLTANYVHATVDQRPGPSFDTDIAAVRFQYNF